jgi:drug/metabolite transporter (DMT)-like permease
MPTKTFGYANIIIGASLMSSVGIFIKLVAGLSLANLVFFRFFFAMIGIIVILLFMKGIKKSIQDLKRNIKWMTLFATFFLLTVIFYFACMITTTVSYGLLLLYTAPVYVYIISSIIDKKFDRRILPIIIMAIAGVFILIGPPTLLYGNISLLTIAGLLAGSLSGIFFSLQFIISNRYGLEHIDGKTRMFYSAIFITALLSPTLLIWQPTNMTYNLPYLASAGVLSTAIGGAFLFEGMRTVEGKRASIAALIEPVVGVMLAVIILHENLSIYNIVGGAMIISSIVWLRVST